MLNNNLVLSRHTWRNVLARQFLLVIAVLLLSALLSPVFAQSNPTDLLAKYQNASPPEDLATRVMTGLLGPTYLAPLTAGIGTNTIFGSIFMVLNVIVFAVGTVWGSYGVIAGIVQTAHEGVVLGKRMSEVWMPVRMATGIGGLVPAFGGFSLSQVTMIIATSWGISFANYAYIEALKMANTSSTLVSPSFSRADPTKDGNALAQVLFAQRLCERSYQDKAASFAASGQVIPDANVVKLFPFTDIYKDGTVIGRAVGVDNNKAGCFAVGLKRKTYAFGLIDQGGRWGTALSFRSGAVNYAAINEQAWNAYAGNFQFFTMKVQRIADTYYDAKKASQTVQIRVPNDELAATGSWYLGAAFQGVENLDNGNIKKSALNNMIKYGFFSAGSFYSTLSEVNAAVAQAGDASEFLITAPVSVPEMASGDYDSIYKSASELSSGSGMGSNKGAVDTCGPLAKENATGNCNWGQSLIAQLLLAGTAGSGGTELLVDPIIAMKNMGDYMMTAGEVILASSWAATAKDKEGKGIVSTAMDVAGMVIPGAGFAGKIMETMGVMAPYIGGLFISVGALCAIYIPMVPFITWVSGLVQYSCIVVEALAAAPLWALSHIQAEGEGMGQRTEKGYLYLLNLLFRPILMVVAFFAASALVIILGSVVMQMYMPVIAAAQGNSVTGILSIIGYIFLFFVMMNTVIQGLFHLVMELPDDAIGWIGGIGKNSMGRGTEDKMHGVFMAGGRFGSSGVDRMMSKPKGDGLDKATKVASVVAPTPKVF